MNIGFFGGTFDPVHNGHLILARTAQERFQLNRIYFVPAHVPPHKQRRPISEYFHRYSMVTLATAGEKCFVPSLLEAPEIASLPAAKGRPAQPAANYSIDTVRRLKQQLKKIDRIFFLIGIDAFKDIAQWREPEALLRECAFIVASRPGYSLADVANALPPKLRPTAAVTKPFDKQPAKGNLVLSGVTIHLLDGVHQSVSATAVREAVAAQKPLGRLVDPKVAEYIKKMELYKGSGSS